MWKDFQVRLCPDNFASFLEMERLTKVRSLDIELPCCDLDSCEVHPEKKEWPVLENICNHPGENLDQIIFRLPCCGNRKIGKWIRSFALTKWEQGIDIAFVI